MKDSLGSLSGIQLERVLAANKHSEWPHQPPPPHPDQNTQAGKPQYSNQEFVCGWGAAFINITLTFPINKIMFRQQLHGIKMYKALGQLQKEGVLHLYRGLLPPLLQKTTSLSIMFGTYDYYQKLFHYHVPGMQMLLNQGSAAFLSGTTEAILTPFERIQTLLQDRYYHDHFKNSFHAFRELRTYGMQEYFRGLSPILMRNGPSNVLFFLLRGEVKKVLPANDSPTANTIKDFISGGVLGAFLSTIFFPLNVVKTQMQSQLGGEFTSLRRAFVLVYVERDRSIRKIFRGVHINYTRSMISWGIINASYELLKKHAFPDLSD